MTRLDQIWDQLFPVEQQRVVRLLVERVVVSPHDIEVRLQANGIEELALELRTLSEREISYFTERLDITGGDVQRNAKNSLQPCLLCSFLTIRVEVYATGGFNYLSEPGTKLPWGMCHPASAFEKALITSSLEASILTR